MTENLPSLLSRASTRLLAARDSAEVLEAKHIAEAALHYAKVTGAANETHADCLRIITRAEIRMANEIDRGQASGELRTRADNQHVQDLDKQGFESLGIDRRRVADWRTMRDVGEHAVDSVISKALSEGRAPTKSEVLQAAKEIRAEKVDAKRAEKIAGMGDIAARNAMLPVGQRKYSVIYADPPWSFEVWSGAGKDRAAENHYPTMTQEQIEALPVGDLAADDCALLMWAVWPQLPEAISVINAWGFEYKTAAFVWVKTTKDGERPATGMGYWTRANSEICLLATKGQPPRLNADVHQIVMSARMEHSRKPDEIAERIERLLAGPYIELFSRRTRPGWDAWGNQSEAA